MKHLLFVDDEPNFLDGMKRMLHGHRQEWQISTAAGVDEALQTIAETAFDVVISDIYMPKKNGFDLLDELQRNRATRPIPVIMLTGSGENEHKRRALKCGATDLLNKPVAYEDLVARITSALRLKEHQDEIVEYSNTLEQKVAERTAELSFLHRDLIWRLAKAGEMRDEHTGEHVIRVAKYCRFIAEKLQLPSHKVELIYLTSPLHDLGKIGIPDKILLKPGSLDDGEWKTMMRHTEIGAAILLEQPKGLTENGPAPSFALNDQLKQTAAAIALHHHEKWDGSGYPQGLRKTDIPLEARIVAFADVYDALRSMRPYKEVFSPNKAWEVIERGAGSHFDPEIWQEIATEHHRFETIRSKSS